MPIILLVDDELKLRQILAQQLGDAGFETIEAADGVEAWDILNGVQVDLVVTDINMPRVGGVRLASWIQAKWPEMPLILMSGSLPAEARAVLKPWNAHFIGKPVTAKSLGQVIRQLLSPRASA
jgi:two-component system, NtrC family, response regulator